MPDPFLHALPV